MEKLEGSQEDLIKHCINIQTHLILNKEHFCCIICHEFSYILFETSCCFNFICNICKNYVNINKCPICKVKYDLKYSKLAKRIISNSLLKCPLCTFSDIFDKISTHVKKTHMDVFKQGLSKLNQNKELMDLIIYNYNLEAEKKSNIHDHMLTMKFKDENHHIYCFIGEKSKYKKCLMKTKCYSLFDSKNQDSNSFESKNYTLGIESIFSQKFDNQTPLDSCNSEQILAGEVEVESINNSNYQAKGNPNYNFEDSESDEDKLKSMFLKNIFFACDYCNMDFCANCINIKSLCFKSKVHQHNLKLIKSDSGWICDGSKEETKCFSGITGYYQTDGMIRFRCKECDYDLCEKCMYYHYESSELKDEEK